MDIVLDSFSHVQFDDPNHQGTRLDWDKEDFERRVNQLFVESGSRLVDGYAPFCKHIFIPNFVGAKLGMARITDANRAFLKTDYVARVPTELPVSVLVRWFPSSQVEPQVAKYLDVILYSREQLRLEAKATGKPIDESVSAPWGIIYVKAQDVDYELPMDPITIFRNALGKEEGGSGMPCDPKEYMESVAFWSNHAEIK
ncbi:hypothetical protein Ae201684_011394 [Aphanomyces euteiches]|uniref:Uncharacterized protein n=1 Tax=Aphanomyces euteiches TaxID=100861 RepID=A0A6G0WV31_9STRA|nr:hypothetical protein Ae201684_011394 [Aphanomyces euteiches]KAH9134253.1 hypothetical protein AeRB84_019919 [Aphanomyces euteiches]